MSANEKNLFQTTIKIWYKSLPLLPKVPWPIIDIKLSNQKISLPQPLLTLVDSGANLSILHPMVAEALGFNLKKIGPAKPGGISVSGNYESWILPQPVDVNVYGYHFQCRFIVINNPKLIWACILGEDSIFQFARLDFQKFKGYFEVRFRTDIN
ncbi:MAG: hypothetical protein ABH816_01955 [Candidatus Levyibacteriota bacterium]